MDVGDRVLNTISSGKFVCGCWSNEIYCKKEFTDDNPAGGDWTRISGGVKRLDVDNSNSKYFVITNYIAEVKQTMVALDI